MAEEPPPESFPLEPGSARVLVVEDEPKLAALLADYLRAAGHEVECVADGFEALQAWTERRHDLVLLDLMLPGLDGLSVCRQLRALTGVPIVMLTARADEADRLAGLELGADDYIPKTPFSPREVMARVKAVLRRSRAAQRPLTLPPPLHVDEQAWRASWQGRALDLTPNEFRLLRTLASQPGRVYPRSQLLELLHGETRAATVFAPRGQPERGRARRVLLPAFRRKRMTAGPGLVCWARLSSKPTLA